MHQIRVKEKVLTYFVETVLCKAGVDFSEAACIAPVFVWTDMIGRRLHGINRLAALVKRFNLGLINSPCDPIITRPAQALIVIDGKNGFGQYLGHLAMTEAIHAARDRGIGMACAHVRSRCGYGL